MTTGTSHFTSLRAACRYYLPYEGNSLSAAALAVDRKLKEGSIHLGPPTLKAGETLSVIDDGARYAITESEPTA